MKHKILFYLNATMFLASLMFLCLLVYGIRIGDFKGFLAVACVVMDIIIAIYSCKATAYHEAYANKRK